MKLETIYDRGEDCSKHSLDVLYNLLRERSEIQCISHKKMPSFEDHEDFVLSKPYKAWYHIIKEGVGCVGAIYLSFENEIGLFIFKRHKGFGYGSIALKLLMELHPEDRYLANIAPRNKESMEFFEKHGFKRIQVTYENRG